MLTSSFKKERHSGDDLGFFSKLFDEFVHVLHNHATLSFDWAVYLVYFKSWGNINSHCGQIDGLNGFLFSFENLFDVWESGSIESKVTCEDSWKVHLHSLEPEVHFSVNLSRLLPIEGDF